MTDLKNLKREGLMEKLNKFIQRVKLAKAHATLMDYLRKKISGVFGSKKDRWDNVIRTLPDIYKQIEGKNGLASGDFPDVKIMQEQLRSFDKYSDIPRLKQKYIDNVDQVLADMAPLMAATKKAFGKKSEPTELEATDSEPKAFDKDREPTEAEVTDPEPVRSPSPSGSNALHPSMMVWSSLFSFVYLLGLRWGHDV